MIGWGLAIGTILTIVAFLTVGWEIVELGWEAYKTGDDAFTAIETIYGSKWNWLMDTLGDIFGAFAITAIILFL